MPVTGLTSVGFQAIHYAAMNGHVEVLKHIIELSQSKNDESIIFAKTPGGKTAFSTRMNALKKIKDSDINKDEVLILLRNEMNRISDLKAQKADPRLLKFESLIKQKGLALKVVSDLKSIDKDEQLQIAAQSGIEFFNSLAAERKASKPA